MNHAPSLKKIPTDSYCSGNRGQIRRTEIKSSYHNKRIEIESATDIAIYQNRKNPASQSLNNILNVADDSENLKIRTRIS